MKDPKSKKQQPWKPLTANYCCSADDHTIFGNFSRCRPSKSEYSKNIAGGAPLPSFRKLSFSDVSLGSSSARINEDLAQSFGGDLYDFQLSELRGVTQNFSSNFLLGEGGFGRVHKGYIDESLRAGLKAQPVAVKLLDIEGLQGHREWLDFNAKLSDFGLAKMGPEGSNTHVTTRVMGTYGYAAPEYVSTGHLTTKSDIYSFGVVLLELLTGRRAMEKMRPKSEQNLVDWARPYLSSSRRLRCIMDPRLAGQYSVKGAKEMGLLALQCVSLNPKDRPKMPAIIETLESLQNLRDMAISHGQWPSSPKSGRNLSYSAKGRREVGFGVRVLLWLPAQEANN
ncbi:UNVERIFIED_CONTAM: putative serine/threonine-protein kinase PBL15 [Sesamum angustifolium]|uniref:Serine/threonine-protein kinase PBL15 n=1 Tax=Sesamum angustifolium TaxID=2727405 RepID=A0AAW2MJD9_9LAMI